MKCNRKCEVFSRVCGYYRPVSQWNLGKKEEFYDRVTYQETKEQIINKIKTNQKCLSKSAH